MPLKEPRLPILIVSPTFLFEEGSILGVKYKGQDFKSVLKIFSNYSEDFWKKYLVNENIPKQSYGNIS